MSVQANTIIRQDTIGRRVYEKSETGDKLLIGGLLVVAIPIIIIGDCVDL